MAQISIVVPIYKVENYICRCVESLLNQTFKDIEVILVDDGSPDNCGKICDDYAEKDKRIKVIHKKNGGLSSARNAGIKAAEGQYIGFVDSDDFVAEDMYELLYKNIEKYSADVSICGLFDCYVGKNITQYNGDAELLVLTREEALRLVLESKKLSVSAVNKLYKKSLFENIKFPVGKLYEDAFTIPKVFSLAEKVVCTSEPKYYYVHREDSITTSVFKENDFDIVKAYEENLSLVKEKFPKLISQAEFRLLWSYTYVFDKMLLSTSFNKDENYKSVYSKLRKETPNILLNPYFSLKRKAVMIILFFSPKFYSFLLEYQKRKNMKLND